MDLPPPAGPQDQAPDPRCADPRVGRFIRFFESLAPDDLARLDAVYAAQAVFKDPFNEVQGLAGIDAVFQHMFRTVQKPRFVVTAAAVQGDQAFVAWDFKFHWARGSPDEQCIRGCSQLQFDADGRVSLHRDYWDAAEELYEKLPVLRWFMGWLKGRLRA